MYDTSFWMCFLSARVLKVSAGGFEVLLWKCQAHFSFSEREDKQTHVQSAHSHWIRSPVGFTAGALPSGVGQGAGCFESARLHAEDTELRHMYLCYQMQRRVIDLLIIRGRSWKPRASHKRLLHSSWFSSTGGPDLPKDTSQKSAKLLKHFKNKQSQTHAKDLVHCGLLHS